MKDARDSQAWVLIVAGVAGLLTVGIAVRHCGSNPSSETAGGPKLAASGRLAASQRGGWIAQSRPGTGGSGVASGRMGGGSTSRSGSSEPRELAPPRRAFGNARDASERDFRDTDTVDTGGDAIAAQRRVPAVNTAGAAGAAGVGGAGAAAGGAGEGGTTEAARPGAGPDRTAKSSAPKDGSSETQAVVAANDPAKTEALDPTGPVLSLPLDNSVQPDKGDTAPIIASGVTFDANGAHFAADAQMFIPSSGNVNPAAGTFTFWMLPDWAGDIESKFYILHLGPNTWENHIDIFKDLRFLRFLFTPDSGVESNTGKDISYWRRGEQHMVTATWGDGVAAMYIDGVAVGAREYDGELDIGSAPPLFIGSGDPNTRAGASSNIRNFQIYTRALNPDEVAALFAQPPS
jgi:hypothetical protein